MNATKLIWRGFLLGACLFFAAASSRNALAQFPRMDSTKSKVGDTEKAVPPKVKSVDAANQTGVVVSGQ
jgi:hypothetical protein